MSKKLKLLSDTNLPFASPIFSKTDPLTLPTYEKDGSIMYSITDTKYYSALEAY